MSHPFPEDLANAIQRAQELVSRHPLFLDTETTGLTGHHEICEIAVVDLTGAMLLNTLVKPTQRIEPGASDVHGITDEMVKDAPTFRDLVTDLNSVLTGRTVLVYNAGFDQDKLLSSARCNGFNLTGKDGFCAWWWKPDGWEGGKSFDPGWHCAMELYAIYHGGWNRYHGSYRWQRLSAAMEQCGLELPAAMHRALADAEMTRQLIVHMAEQKRGETQSELFGGE